MDAFATCEIEDGSASGGVFSAVPGPSSRPVFSDPRVGPARGSIENVDTDQTGAHP